MKIEKQNFELIRDLPWEEVFEYWRKSEGEDSPWLTVAKKDGFENWEKWRLEKYALPVGCAEAKWKLYKIKKPLTVVPKFFGGPFESWTRLHYGGEKTRTFQELVKLPAIENHEKIRRLSRDYPIESTIVCLRPKNGNIYTVEGMHRCSALALMAAENISFSKEIFMALGELDLDELPDRKEYMV